MPLISSPTSATINNNVIVEDGGIIVLGGLIDESLRESDSRVPILGSIPVLGNLFRSRSTSKIKRNLMVFIRVKILRDENDAFIETNSKVPEHARPAAWQAGSTSVSLMPGEATARAAADRRIHARGTRRRDVEDESQPDPDDGR